MGSAELIRPEVFSGVQRILLRVVDGFELTSGREPVPVPANSQRLLAFLALHNRPLERAYVAGVLWSETSDGRAAASLRSALWRLPRPGCALVNCSGTRLRLFPYVVVDVADAAALAHRLVTQTGDDILPEGVPAALQGDVLPEWYDDWVLVQQERFRQVRLHALEALSERLTLAGRTSEGIEAALAAIAAEPLRESAHRALIQAHVAEGNAAEAIRQYHRCEALLSSELGIKPSPLMSRLMERVLNR